MATIYVDGYLEGDITDGKYSIANHDNSGSAGDAYRTIAGAVAASSANDTISIRGAYSTFNGTYNITQYINVNKNLTIQAYSTSETHLIYNKYVVTGNGDWQTFYSTTATITYRDLKIRGDRLLAVDEDFGHIGINSTAGYVIIDGCEIYEFNHCGVKVAKTWIKNTYIHDIGSTGDTLNDHGIYCGSTQTLGDEGIVEYNRFDNITGASIHLYGSNQEYFIVRYNICDGSESVNTRATWGLLLQGGYNNIYGNVFYGANYGVVLRGVESHNNNVKNNIIDNSNTADIGIDDEGLNNYPVNNQVRYNFLGSATTLSGNETAEHATYDDTADPYFNVVSATNPFIVASPANWYDFRLGTGSVCIGAGTNLGTDHDDALDPDDVVWPPTTRQQGAAWDIGAFLHSGIRTLFRP